MMPEILGLLLSQDHPSSSASRASDGDWHQNSTTCMKWTLTSIYSFLGPWELFSRLSVFGLKYIHIQTCGTCVRMYQPPLLSGHSSPVGVSNLAEDGPLSSLLSPFCLSLPSLVPTRPVGMQMKRSRPQLVCTSAAFPTSARRKRDCIERFINA